MSTVDSTDVSLFLDRVDAEQGWRKLLMHMTFLLGGHIVALLISIIC